MFLRSLILIGAGATLLATASCGPKVIKRACMGSGTDNPLVAGAAMVRLDVYGAGAHCADGSTLAAGAGAPIFSRSYLQGQAISADVPPGPHALVLSTFADTDGTQLLGIGCTEADLAAGSQICFDLTIEPGPDGGDDLSGAVCSTNPDDCPPGAYCNGMQCVLGCKGNADCPKNDAGLGSCDPTTHTCTDCNVAADCGNAPGAACCNGHCVNTKSDPQNCSACGMACTGSGAQCCNGACSNPLSDVDNCGGCGMACSSNHMATRTCTAGACNGTCATGFADCNGSKLTDGCERDVTTTTDCGGCNVACSTTTGTASCVLVGTGPQRTCSYVCTAPLADCQTSAPDTNGCETNKNTDPANCGGCGMACSANHISPHCTSGNCDGACVGAFADCNGDKRSDGCERATNTVTDCSGCNLACNATASNNTARSCDGTTCSYTCATNQVDCDGSTKPDLNGCECAGNGCCTNGSPSTFGSCQTTHMNGLGQNFWDCLPLNTYTMSQAQAAARAYDPAGLVDGANNHYVNPKNSADTVDYICTSSTAKNACPCWAWQATGAYAAAAGLVDLHTPSSSTNCYFPLGTGFPGWN